MYRRTLPVIDITNSAGLYTKTNPDLLAVNQLRVAENIDYFRVYGAISKINGNKRVLTQPYKEEGIVKPISWIGFYKYTSLDGQILRHPLIAAGTTFQRIEPDGSLTLLRSGYPSGIIHTSDMFDRWLLITAQDPDFPGNRGTPLKYDGEKLVDWGIVPPGSQETVIRNFDDLTGWTSTNCSVSLDSTTAWKGKSFKVVKTNFSSNTFYIEELDSDFFSINSIVEDRAFIYVYLPLKFFQNLKTSGPALSVYLTSDPDFSTNYYRFDFQIGRLFPGWNKLLMDLSTVPTGDFGTVVGDVNLIDENALKSIRLEANTSNIINPMELYWDHFVSLDQGAPDPVNGPSGSVFNANDVYTYRITFLKDDGTESNAGPVSASVTIQPASGSNTGSASIELSNIPISSDPGIIGRNIYRTVRNGNDWLYVDTIYDNVTTTYSDKIPDTGLSVQNPPLEGFDILDNSPPPNASIVKVWKRTVFMAGDPINPNLLYFSRDDLPDAFPLLNAFEFDEPITGIFEASSNLIITTLNSYWRVFGDNPDYIVEKIVDGFGAVGPRAVGSARIVGWAGDFDGLRLYDSRDTVKITEVVQNLYQQFNRNTLSKLFTVHFKRTNSFLIFPEENDPILHYQYAIDDMRNGWFSTIKFDPNLGFKVLDAEEIEDQNGIFRLYISADDGMVYELFAEDSYDWEDALGNKYPVEMKYETIYLRAGSTPIPITEVRQEPLSVTGRVDIRFVEMRAVNMNNGNAFNLDLTLKTASGPDDIYNKIRDTKNIIFNFKTNTSLQRYSIDVHSDEFVKLVVSNKELGVLPTVYGVRLYFMPRPSQYPVT